MDIVPVTEDRKRFLPLLLLADEQESMIDRYLSRGQMFALYDGGLKAVAVVTCEGPGLYELKNLAVAQGFRRRGYGSAMIRCLLERYQGRGTMQVGTGDSPLTLPFYESCGFRFSHVEKDFFVKNYDHPVIEEGRRLTDMIYLRREL